MTTASPSGGGGITPEDAIKDDDNARAAYAVIAARAQGHNHLQWQTPSLALAAEAFLLNIALGHDSTAPARLVASALNFALSLLCMHLMWKHRQAQIDDRQILMGLENRLGLHPYHEKPDVSDLPWWKQRLLTSTTTIWIGGFGVLAAVALGIFAVTLRWLP
jgi:hypothetical protein